MATLSTAQRAARVMRWAGPLESTTLLAFRSFSSSSGEAAGAGGQALGLGSSAGAASLDAAADSLAVAADGATAAAAAAAGGGGDPGAVLGAAMAAVDGLHAATGLPWWATICSVGVAVRVAMFPVSLQGMKASAALMPLLRQARDEVAASMRRQLNAAAPAAAAGATQQEEAERHGGGSRQQRWQRKQQAAAAAVAALQQQQQQRAAGSPSPLPPPPPGPSMRQILARFHQLRQAAGAPHPAWALASPLAQLPVFITAMAAIRTMSLSGWPGFSTGGGAWFPDLTLPAMDLATWTAPMGMAGVVLPVGIVLSMLANIDAAFTGKRACRMVAGWQQLDAKRRQLPAGSRQQASVMLWVMGGLRLLLEWMMVPLFAIALQLPQGALCYWAAGSGLALLQNHALKQPAVRRAVGLPTGTQQPTADAAPARPAPDAAAAAAAAVAAGAVGPIAAGVDPELRHFLLTTSDQAALFDRVAHLRAEGRAGATCTVLQRLLQLYPGQPNALYALGQLDAQSRARAWFGAAVAMHMQQEHDAAIHTFGKAAEAAQTDELRVRCWVSQATLHRKLGQLEAAVELLRRAAKAEPKVEQAYLQPLLAEMAGQPPGEGAQLEGQPQEQSQGEEGEEAEARRQGEK
ncbi:hypothetical protein CHLNCDRAFT_142761 [Chlorella variabilis]|uniref:Uncharacterized protein n=1 Tax=Chlorella variabilis TaxID=554065 RepID=E1Z8P2_CHLVA|nr:hypothetical protein CHLNCDRAFT_142761 [Chlorella variabilis]EFN57373.1 hypothetical protein CHLNCDRAFT_142761 [Chlorella variabilis]|eukprot:XP_005849475.1 hypothetical protein CHLNCDRAFT_142761 [Chlorella variabilis]